MKRFKIEDNKFERPDIYVTLFNPPYENENILHKTGWKEKDVVIKEIHSESADQISYSMIDSDFIGEE